MRRDRLLAAGAPFALALAFLALTTTTNAPAAAQPSRLPRLRAPRLHRQLALSRISAGEAGLEITDDAAAIYYVLARRAMLLGITWDEMARRYSTRDLLPRPGARREWLGDLWPNGARPFAWPARTAWAPRHRDRWLALYRHAGRILRGEVPDQPADHWGIARRTHREYRDAVRRGWTPVDCGDVRNAFWRVPRRGRS